MDRLNAMIQRVFPIATLGLPAAAFWIPFGWSGRGLAITSGSGSACPASPVLADSSTGFGPAGGALTAGSAGSGSAGGVLTNGSVGSSAGSGSAGGVLTNGSVGSSAGSGLCWWSADQWFGGFLGGFRFCWWSADQWFGGFVGGFRFCWWSADRGFGVVDVEQARVAITQEQHRCAELGSGHRHDGASGGADRSVDRHAVRQPGVEALAECNGREVGDLELHADDRGYVELDEACRYAGEGVDVRCPGPVTRVEDDQSKSRSSWSIAPISSPATSWARPSGVSSTRMPASFSSLYAPWPM